MISYAERVDDVCGLLTSRFGIIDRQLISILLAARIDCPIPYPWLILEADYFSLDTVNAWFGFGYGDALPLAKYRVLRPRHAYQQIEALFENRNKPVLHVESNWTTPTTAHSKLRLYPYLMQQCVRVRSETPKVAPPDQSGLLQLKQEAEAALDTRWRSVEPRLAKPTPRLLYYAELLQRLAPMQRDWDTLVQNLCAIASRHAYLYDRAVSDEDWQAVVRVISGTIPLWTAKILRQFASNGRWHSLKGYYAENEIRAEVRRLISEGIVYSYKSEWRLMQRDEIGQDVLDMIEGDIVL